MNERIKELIAKAKREDADAFPIGEQDMNRVMAKFAELIIQECIDQCDDNGSTDEWDRAVRWSANQIKEHFGVTE